MDIVIRRMDRGETEEVSLLADKLVGVGYYPPSLVADYMDQSTSEAGMFSYVASLDDRLVAFRFVLPPGRWEHGRGRGLSVDRWPAPLTDSAYFQSCFVDDGVMGQGIGRKLAWRALWDLKESGARAVVAHSWKESPHGSSLRYLERLGFQAVDEHPEYWKEVDYHCRRCGSPCLCTAVEMVLDLQLWEPPAEAATVLGDRR